jgi:hypothetical protein
MVDNIKNCTVYFGPCSGSIFIRESSDSVVNGICQQYRISNSKNITSNIYVNNKPAVEACESLIFDKAAF